MPYRNVAAVLVLPAVLGVGCSGGVTEPDPSAADAEEDWRGATLLSPEAQDNDLLWAKALADDHTRWTAATTEPIWTPAYQASLCIFTRFVGGAGSHSEHYNWIYINPTAHDAFMAMEAIPVGGIIIKQKLENYDYENPDSNQPPTALGIMIKREPGYDPDHGDWEYAYITLDDIGRVTDATRGRISTCIDCHANQARTDYLFRGYLPGRIDDIFEISGQEPDRVPGPPLLRGEE